MLLSALDLLDFYRQGYFPMAEHADDEEFMIVAPKVRALLPIRDLHISKSLQKLVKKAPFEIRIDTDFAAVIAACAEQQEGRPETWINAEIQRLFIELHEMGYAHSVECWREGKLVGGLYGLALGGLFCGESMFSRVPNASKVALVHLCARLDAAGFSLLDAQFRNPHLEQFGLYEMPQADYVRAIQPLLSENHTFPQGFDFPYKG
jgi:leucyl/phenylalanyl-tRNA--protein transferase